ncbi:hypothetical protein RchiOBHm_Chr4g0393811 [Rosa chinensis]|uniref:Uncharacterized protein n=1 Tax=Rosa chinensis TaxID=74649 RepID=A0A2P6QR24_ROSCH|nr:hypothetical protein RchiOBHm_Chr4g0393811 [Rosa chinensis]
MAKISSLLGFGILGFWAALVIKWRDPWPGFSLFLYGQFRFSTINKDLGGFYLFRREAKERIVREHRKFGDFSTNTTIDSDLHIGSFRIRFYRCRTDTTRRYFSVAIMVGFSIPFDWVHLLKSNCFSFCILRYVPQCLRVNLFNYLIFIAITSDDQAEGPNCFVSCINEDM